MLGSTLVMLRKGEWVWLDTGTDVPIGAKLKVTPSGQRLLVDDVGKEHHLFPEQEASLKIMHPTSVEGVDDMIRLGDMTEAGLLRNLQLRHKRGIIYTYTGSVLVAVNPYQFFPIYSNDQVRLYHGKKLGQLPPHIFALAESCYFNMKRYFRNQCCIISGESGAGKTESTKLIVQYLAAISGERSEQQIEKQILESNPILEGFGNAKTIRNDNSSRFGKYLEIIFNDAGAIEGARVEQYLLEKSRVCHQAKEERNYHIFYCMLAGITAEEKKHLGLQDANGYKFLIKGECMTCEGRDDAEDFKRIRSAMKILTFSDQQCYEIFKLLAAILHLGNVYFEGKTQNYLETSDVSKSENFNTAASLLEVKNSVLAKCLTHHSLMTKRERVTKPLDCEQASACRDAFVKAIYNKLFIWIVEKINDVVHKRISDSPKSQPHLSIGLLDIFGFENFQINSFEQLCINFANEKLQQFFVGHIFKLEQKEYLKEQIMWNTINFVDNHGILELLAGKPCNLLALIDEESHFPKGSDLTMLSKMNQQHHGDKAYIPPKSEHDTDFGIHHFAGIVFYESKGFLEKNRDAVSTDIFKMLDMSTNKLLQRIFTSELSTNGVNMTNKRVMITPNNSIRSVSNNRKQVPTLSGQFRKSLDTLMKALTICQPYFIRCFKPNNNKLSEDFDRELCIRQLRCCGMMDTIRIRKLGYAVRHTFAEFLKRYRVLLKTTTCDPKTNAEAACCEAICHTVFTEPDEWKIGKTKIFLKDTQDAVLERLREEELNRNALVIQHFMVGCRHRKSFLMKRRAVMVLQRYWRAYQETKATKKILQGFHRLVSKIRGRKLLFQYQRQHAAAVTLQKHVRHYQARKRQIDAVTLLQAYTRRFLARKLFERMKVEVPVYPDPHTTSEDHETEGDIASALTFRLEKVCMQSEQANEEFEPVIEVDLEDNKSNVLPITALDLKDNKSNISEVDLENNEDNVPLNIEIDLEDNENNVAPIPPLRVTMCEDLESDETEYAETRSEISINASDMTNPTPTPSLEEEEDDFEDFTEDFSFYKFSLLHFQSEMSHTHIKHRLKNPLLQHNDEGDILASLTVWWIILRFMGDLPEPRSPDSTSQVSSLSISRHLPNRQARRLSNLVGLDQKILRKNKKKHGTRKASAILEETENLTEDEDVLIGEGPTLDRPLSSLEKLHIIVGYALSKRGIRDEIYCQICKQLLNNKKQTSCMQGWALLSICLGIFPPTDLFFKYLETFIRKGPNGYAEYCSKRLNRIRANGERKELPSWMEYQASIAKEPIEMTVILTDGSQISLQLDSASTSAEVCQTVADKINLRDTYGFSLYIHLFDKMWSLGSCGKHVFDAVSQCEQEMRRQGRHEKDTPVQLTIRKELFTPWHDCSEDSISTDLIYKQVIQGIKSGEYTCEKDDAYIYLATKHYYIQFGSAYKKENVCKVVEDIIAVPLIEYKSMTKWIQLISEACLQDTYTNGTMSKESVKGELVDSARMDWPVHFSKFYDVTMMSGPLLPKSRFFVAVNWNGIFFMDGRDKKLLECPYLEMREVKKLSEQSVSVATVRGEFVLMCSEADDMNEIVQQNLTGLRARSVFALAEQDFNKTDDPTFLVCKQGDLLMIENQQENSFDKNVVKATNQKTNISGSIYKYALQFLPTLTRPTDEMLELLSPGQRKLSVTQTGAQREETIAPVSLREFALENFRPQDKERLWVCSREPVKQPLMKNLVHNSDLNSLACSAFTSILKYMGDYPIKQVRSPIELTDQIFGPAIQHKLLQDEIYCQIMKQMTNNNNRLSMERGWQLMWLCSGLFPPSQDLLRHAQRFLESRTRQPLATECLQRLKQMRSKEPRKRPPPLVEIDAIQQNSTHIFHKIHFPNDTHDLYEVTSTTTIQELCYSISSQLNLRSPDGYGLYLKTPNKMLSLIEDEYFFDSLREASDISKKGKKVREVSLAYGLIFKRKLWFNVIPGKDLVADLTFHFPQEVPKYLLGYHNCSKDDMIRLGGLLFRAKVDSDRSQFVMIPKMLRDLVPADQIKSLSPEEWKKNIMSSYNKQSGITLDECKIAFLQAISSWPTFGCSFFEVKQMCESSYPSTVLIAISKQGVSLIDPKSKELLVLHPFSRITECHSRGDYFQMTIGTLVKGNIFTCETFQGHTMEDLLRSYVRMYERERQAFQTNKKKVFS